MFFTEQLPSFDLSFYDFTIDVNHLTNRLDIAVRLFSNRSKMTSKSVKNKEVAKSQTLLLVSSSCLFFFFILLVTSFFEKFFSEVVKNSFCLRFSTFLLCK